MLDELSSTCGATGCERALDADGLMIELRTEGGIRRAYECECGAVTVTVARG